MALAMAMAPSLGRTLALRPISSSSSRLGLDASSFAPTAAASSLSSARGALFSGGSSWGLFSAPVCVDGAKKRPRQLVVRAGKASMACTKRSRSRKSRARAQGFRKRMSTPGGRNVLRRRRRKGRKVLVPQSNPNSGKRA
ncbi:50S ribosomal protein L34, chloroplastic-like [Selaginella moellendorffii]|uniref:50S ribosomal protein L34, chloroplastic-like n=1 Tax=Selaginella moellendorffii TaxID=88036 RepID=UPI000D1D0126|nr:50S ribosomal protein L34, chloroplastic-like [Selaginella moellendorffii]XP_024544219.1 50S ribosomal protein L34, chloroplastic-like [Selaginella moellendorffii]|eukprot:XP_024534456.1 50S ribosomal protein L34, chloroplastic-like [Selaginella moellendorffii]